MSKLEYISLHIPKTAGTSFYKTLEDAYGIDGIARFDIKSNIGKLLLNQQEYHETFLPHNFQLLQGHFSVKDLYEHFPTSANIPIITWLRNPIDRVISNYYYLAETLQAMMSTHEKNRAVLDKMMKSLEEFICSDVNRNKMSAMTDGKSLQEFFFIGIYEYYTDDLLFLSSLLRRRLNSFEVNKTTNKNSVISEEIKLLIEHNNQNDMELYKEALSIRERRFKA